MEIGVGADEAAGVGLLAGDVGAVATVAAEPAEGAAQAEELPLTSPAATQAVVSDVS